MEASPWRCNGFATPRLAREAELEKTGVVWSSCPVHTASVKCASLTWPTSGCDFPANSCLSSTSLLWDVGFRVLGHTYIWRLSAKSCYSQRLPSVNYNFHFGEPGLSRNRCRDSYRRVWMSQIGSCVVCSHSAGWRCLVLASLIIHLLCMQKVAHKITFVRFCPLFICLKGMAVPITAFS